MLLPVKSAPSAALEAPAAAIGSRCESGGGQQPVPQLNVHPDYLVNSTENSGVVRNQCASGNLCKVYAAGKNASIPVVGLRRARVTLFRSVGFNVLTHDDRLGFHLVYI
jgi:hypothetical protein